MIQILKKGKHKGAKYFIQRLGYDCFQWIIYRKGKFYPNGWIRMKPRWYKFFKKNPYSKSELENCVKWCDKAAMSTIETIEAMKKNEK